MSYKSETKDKNSETASRPDLVSDLRRSTASEIHPTLLAGSDSLMRVYWIGCNGLARAAEQINSRIDRIGCSTEPDLSDRLSTAGKDAYGSWTFDQAGALIQEDGFSRWIMQVIATTRDPKHPAITAKTRTLEVLLPRTLTRRAFDSALRRALAPWSLSNKYPDLSRFTLYSIDKDRLSKAVELYAGLDPRRDGDRLLSAVEAILDHHQAALRSAQPRPKQLSLFKESDPKEAAPRRTPRPMSPAQHYAMRARLRGKNRRRAPKVTTRM